MTAILTHVLAYILTYVLTYVLAYVLTYVLTYVLANALACALTYVLAYILASALAYVLTDVLADVLRWCLETVAPLWKNMLWAGRAWKPSLLFRKKVRSNLEIVAPLGKTCYGLAEPAPDRCGRAGATGLGRNTMLGRGCRPLR